MRIFLDACVLFPSVTRGLLLGAAGAGYFTPLWSQKVLDEWQHAALRQSEAIGAQARTEILLSAAHFPKALCELPVRDDLESVLPDPGDIHVLAAALEADAQAILTANLADFPPSVLARFGLLRRAPDEFLLEFAKTHPSDFELTLKLCCQTAGLHSGDRDDGAKLLKKARLPRLAKWLRARASD